MKIRCTHCKSVIESKSRHDLVHCKCGRIFIDGGKSTYVRIGFKEQGDYEEVKDEEEKS